MLSFQQKLCVSLIVPFTLSCTSLAVRADIKPNSTTVPTFTLPNNCNTPPSPEKKQYIIGYGSLMQEQSRLRTSPSAGLGYPVMVSGYRRGWYARGNNVGFDTTYLGIIPEASSQVNAVLYQIKDEAELLATDRRENFYCRLPVKPPEFKLLVEAPAPSGEVWIYVNRPEGLALPDRQYPIVQSYVDIFLSGCLEQEKKYQLTDFAKQCIKTTRDWSAFWVNDRLYPRRPHIYQPQADRIDLLIKDNLPEYFRKIKIE